MKQFYNFLQSAKYLHLVTLVFLVIQAAMGQDPNEKSFLPSISPPSPTTASLGKYGETPVSLYTGIPNINIPLYEITDGPLQLPLSISYHAGGIKVEEIASRVGLGWSLNAGGMIGRRVRGLDDLSMGWNVTSDPAEYLNTILQSNNSQKKEQLTLDILKEIRDGEADIYYYNFGGYSGKFFLTESGQVHSMPIRPLEIKRDGPNWKIISENGTVYSFTTIEYNAINGEPRSVSAWYLTEIRSADTGRSIRFTYDNVNYSYNVLGLQQKKVVVDGACPNFTTNYAVMNTVDSPLLKKIEFSGGYIDFTYGQNRCDLPGERTLDYVSIYSNSKLLKKYSFTYKYTGVNAANCSYETAAQKRLVLTQIVEENQSERKNPYFFEYNELVTLPDRLAYSQDLWGYYNGKTTNQSLVPSFFYPSTSGVKIYTKEADRSVNPATAQAQILRKIIYPTKGSTEFFYESNTTSDSRVEQEIDPEVVYFGGSYLSAPLPIPYESQEFTIDNASGSTTVDFIVNGLDCLDDSQPPPPGCDMRCYINLYRVDVTPKVLVQSVRKIDNGLRINLNNGRYKLAAEQNDCQLDKPKDFSITLTINKIKTTTTNFRYVGGLRIQKMIDKAYVNSPPQVKTYKYHKENDVTASSGSIVNFPTSSYSYALYHADKDPYNQCVNGYSCLYFVQFSKTNYPLASTGGGNVGYQFVTVDLGENGYTTYKYTSTEDYPNSPELGFPFAPTIDYDWRRGLLLEQKDYVRNGSTVHLAKYKENEYGAYLGASILGLKVGRVNQYTGDCRANVVLGYNPPYGTLSVQPYTTLTEFMYLQKTTEQLYSQNDYSKYIETVTENEYSPTHFQPIKAVSKTSMGETQTVYTKYPPDYSTSNSMDAGIKNLQNLHIINPPIERIVTKKKPNSSTELVMEATLNTFQIDKPYPKEIKVVETMVPLENTLFQKTTFANNLLIADPHYRSKLEYTRFDTKGNPVEFREKDNIPNVYLWGYDSQYPVAQIENATYQEVESLLGQTVIAQLAVANPGTDEQVRQKLSPLRTLKKAMINIYTYDPLVGVTSQTGPDGITVFYEYDELQRLKVIKDQKGDIVKRYQYHYTGQPQPTK